MNQIPHSEAWGLVVVMTVVGSWILYHYFAPKSWREWASAGVVQAFIIALYAEMYGFPLSIYLAVRFFGLDSSNLNASLWSTLFGVGELGMMIFMIPGYVLLFTGIALFAQGWREVYRARPQNRLVTDGLYGVVRHPQYLGLFIALFGEGVVHWPTPFSVGLFPIIVLVYAHLARKEEQKMVEQFGDEYRAYQRRVPMFVPSGGKWQELFRFSDAASDKH